MERYVLEALQKAVIAAVAPTTLPVKYVGRTLTIPSSDKWVEVVYIPNNIENQYWNQSKTYRGIMRLILHWPVDDTGVYPALTVAQQIADGLTKGLKFTDLGSFATVMISEVPNIGGVLEQAPEILIPLTVRYICFKA